MIAYNTLAAGTFYLLAGLFGLLRHFLLEPHVKEMPKTPQWLLGVFFAFSTVMVYVGLKFLTVWWTGAATTVPPGVTGLGVMLAFTVFFYKGSLLADTVMRKPSFTLDDIVKGLLKAKGTN